MWCSVILYVYSTISNKSQVTTPYAWSQFVPNVNPTSEDIKLYIIINSCSTRATQKSLTLQENVWKIWNQNDSYSSRTSSKQVKKNVICDNTTCNYYYYYYYYFWWGGGVSPLLSYKTKQLMGEKLDAFGSSFGVWKIFGMTVTCKIGVINGYMT